MSLKKVFTKENFKEGGKDVIKSFDLFSIPVTGNYKSDPEYETMTGGLISLILIITITITFSNTLLNTFNKAEVESRVSQRNSENPEPYNVSMNFVVGISDIDLNKGKRYFHIYMEQRIYNQSQSFRKKIPLKACEKADWEASSYGNLYDSMDLEQYLCPENSSELELQLQGKYTSEIFTFYKIGVKKCTNEQDPSRPCATEAEIEEYLKNKESFGFNFYFMNAMINPSEESYFQKYFEDSNYFFFSPYDGVEANLLVSDYKIATDESLSPFPSYEEIEGAAVLNQATISPYKVRKDEYMKFYIRKSPISIDIEREFRKVDDTLSYIGGLFSFLLMFFAFIRIYNEFSFEIDVTKNSYKEDDFDDGTSNNSPNEKSSEPFNAHFFNLYTFFWYLIYLGFEMIGYELNWPEYKKMHDYLTTARKGLDITYQLKKSQFNEKLWTCILNLNQLESLMMSGPLSLKEAEKMYEYLDMHKKLKKRYFPNGEWIGEENKGKFEENKLTADSAEGNSIEGHLDQSQNNETSKEEECSTEEKDEKEEEENETVLREDEVRKILDQLNTQSDPLSIKIMKKVDPIIKKHFFIQETEINETQEEVDCLPPELKEDADLIFEIPSYEILRGSQNEIQNEEEIVENE